ncbi:MAG: tetratricopeptide repeat protein [Candidatus Heimdallarchaeota archaeon]|nr:tetratricopeptide repeat protein [Candidatus Heimdallarchaeota archaeon]
MSLNKARELFEQGKLDEAIETLQFLDDDAIVEGSLYESTIWQIKGEYKIALKIAKGVLTEGRSSDRSPLKLASKIVIAFPLRRIGQVKEASEMIAQVESELESLSNSERKWFLEWEGSLNNLKGIISWSKGNLEESHTFYQRAFEIFTKLDHRFYMAFTLQYTGVLLYSMNRLEESSDHYNRALQLYSDINYPQGISQLSINLAINCYQIGDYDSAIELYHQSLEIIQNEDGYQQDVGSLYNSLGSLYRAKGEYSKSLVYHLQSLRIQKERDNKTEVANCYHNIGRAYQIQGDLSLAMDYCQRSLEIYQSLENKSDIYAPLENIGVIYSQWGKFSHAKNLFEKSLEINRHQKNEINISQSLYLLISINLILNSRNEALTHLEELKELNESTNVKSVNVIFRLSKALILKNHKRLKNKIEAQLILEELVEEDIVKHELTISAMLNLVSLLILELKTSKNEEILSEIVILVGTLKRIAKENKMFPLLTEILLLQSKLEMANLNRKKSKVLLEQAHIIAQEKGLHSLAITVSNELDHLISQTTTREKNSGKIVPAFETIGFGDFENDLAQLIQPTFMETPVQEHEIPVMLILLNQNEGILWSKSYSEEIADRRSLQKQLLDYLRPVFNRLHSMSNGYERVKFGKHTVLIKSWSSFLLCYVFDGFSSLAVQKIDTIYTSLVALRTFRKKREKLLSRLDETDQELIEQIADSLLITAGSRPQSGTSHVSFDHFKNDILSLPQIAKELNHFKYLMHPIRIAIVRLLFYYTRITRSDLLKTLGINSGVFDNHLNQLSKNGIIEVHTELVENRSKVAIYINSYGIKQYEKFKQVLEASV